MATSSIAAPLPDAAPAGASQRPALSPEHQAIVKSTVPVLAEHGVAITSHFYKRLLNNHPELRNIFNSAHQSTGTQPAALAHAVLAYAAHIDDLGVLTSAVSRIGNKHASLGITPDQYPIVGENLLASIKEVLGDAVDQPVLDAWAAAYQQLADIFIDFELDLYQQSEQTSGGWTGWRKFRVARKVPESDEIISFYLEPADGGPLPHFKSGQYISIRVFVPERGVYQPRQYSLSDTDDGKHFRISVKREAAKGVAAAGLVSNVLHEKLPEGAELDVSNPYGDFTLDVEASGPVVLIAGGVGLTPLLSMLGTLVEHAPQRPVVFVHAVRNGKVQAMKGYLSRIIKDNPQVSRAIFYEYVDDSEQQGVDYDFEGRLEIQTIKDKVLLPDATYYLCGPIPFMQTQQKSLEALGVPPERIHSEVFGSGVL
ncbi:nitric oxide dioxygenase [Capronia epimyces CBS 606.96]|uniref:Flavohemoprotein n=1 Tax=Capronia epimyces CBS 606.96 TaxID=1182542 RepID=W9YS10_9EURO|nr:nitric oxide dioxygenase [Capronia epimyces CBS 606.96]EXJ85069.1 nitric oxide dioxygenase [Capronia epimyces CBS 606.96]